MEIAIIYDKAKWHFGGKYPDGLSTHQAYIHTGMFLGWIVDHDLFDKEAFAEYGLLSDIEAFKSRSTTPAQLFEKMDGVLSSDDLNDTGNAFAQSYFDFEKGQYLKDYDKTFCRGLFFRKLPSMYHVTDSIKNYLKIKAVIDKRYQKWLENRVLKS